MNPRRAEWPPSPARVFCALVAAAAGDESGAKALRVLESHGAPEIWASADDAVAEAERAGYVVTNAFPDKPSSQSWPGRKAGLRRRVSLLPSCDTFALTWPKASLDEGTVRVLKDLAWRTPYIGRSTCDAEVTVTSEAPEMSPQWVVWEPLGLGIDATAAVESHTPYPGYLDALETTFRHGEPAWSAQRRITYYRIRRDTVVEAPPAATARVYRDWVVLRFSRESMSLPSDEAMRVAEVLREAVISHVQREVTDVPAAISGHGANGTVHVAFAALPNVGGDYGDGRLLGAAVGVPVDMPDGDRKALLRGVASIENLGHADGRWRVAVDTGPSKKIPYGLTVRRWIGSHRGTCDWVSATPLMLDKFPQPRGAVIPRISQSLQLAGYPEPVEIEVLPGPALTGGIVKPVLAAPRSKRPRRPLVHCRIRFDQPVVGPVLAGALRYLGIGLFVPDTAVAEEPST